MEILSEETLLKIKLMSPDKQKQVIDGIAKLLAIRAHDHGEELQDFCRIEGNS